MKFIKTLLKIFFADIISLASFFSRREGELGVLLKQGFLEIDNACKSENYTDIISQVNEIISNPSDKKSIVDIRNSHDGKEFYDQNFVDIKNVDLDIPELKRIINIEKIEKVIKSYDNSISLQSIHIYKSSGVTNTRCFHYDSFKKKQIKVFIYLSDVLTLDLGPYCYIKGSHRLNIYRYLNVIYNFIKGYPLSDSRLYPSRQEKRFLAPKGACVMSLQDGAHRGFPQNKEAVRYVSVLNYYQL